MSESVYETILMHFKFLFFLSIAFLFYYDRSFLIEALLKTHSAEISQILVFGAGLCFAITPFLYKNKTLNTIFIIICIIMYFFTYKLALFNTDTINPLYRQWSQVSIFWVMLFLALHRYIGAKSVIFLIHFVLVYSFFSAGISKLRNEVSWINGYTLSYYMSFRAMNLNLLNQIEFFSNLTVMRVFSILIIAFELLTPLSLFSKKASVIFFISTVSFLIISMVLIDIYWLKYCWMIFSIFPIVWYHDYRQSEPRRKSLTLLS